MKFVLERNNNSCIKLMIDCDPISIEESKIEMDQVSEKIKVGW